MLLSLNADAKTHLRLAFSALESAISPKIPDPC